jgi:hypothetical protein
MKPIVKNLLIVGTLTIIGLTLLAKEKIDQTMATFGKIGILPNSLPKQIKFSNPNAIAIPQNISFNMDILIENPDTEDLSVSGFGVAKLREVQIFFKNVLLGTTNLQLNEITIPAKGKTVLKDVAFTGKTLAIGQNIAAFANPKLADFKFLGTIEILGIDYEIGA